MKSTRFQRQLHHRFRGRHVLGVAALAISVGVALAGCSSASNTSSSSSGSGATYAANAKKISAEITHYEGPPTFVKTGPSFSTASLKGKTIYDIPVASDIPFNASIVSGEQQAAALVGAKVVLWPNTGQQTEWVTGMDTAIAQHAALIVLLGTDPSVLGPQIAQAKAVGIPVITTHELGAGAPLPTGVTASVPAPFAIAGTLMADYAMKAEKGKVNAIVLVSNDAPSTKYVTNTLLPQFKKECGSECKLDVINIPVPNWATDIATDVQTALSRNPGANVIIPIYDGMVANTLTGVNTAHAASKVKIITFNGTPSVLAQIKTGAVAMDVGESTPWIGWTDMDLAFREIAGQKLVTEPASWVRIWDSSNLSQAGNPPAIGVGYGNAYVAGFKAEWEVAK